MDRRGKCVRKRFFVPVDQGALTRGQGIYDVSLSLDKESTYVNSTNRSHDPDKGSLNIAAVYERPVMRGTNVLAGFRSSEHEGERNTVGNLGVSTTLAEVLVNGEVAVDDEGEMAAEVSLRKDFDSHQVRNSFDWQGENFDSQTGGNQADLGTLQNTLSVSGPLPFEIGSRPRYNFRTGYFSNTDNDYGLDTSAGFNTSFGRISFNEQITHRTDNTVADDTLDSVTNITGAYGRNRLRVSTNYGIKPETELKNILATYHRDFTKNLDLELGVSKRYQTSLTEYSAKLDWQAGFIRLSPNIKYTNKEDFFAGLNTRFSVLRDPARERLHMQDYSVTSFGGVSAFVYLDKDGDGLFNGDDEPLEGVVVKAPQNGGRAVTDEAGIALFNRMGKLRVTDIFVDPEALQDPTWVAGFEGVSVLPREGHIAEVNFPIHISGEIDGSVYARAVSLPQDEIGADQLEEEDSSALLPPEPVPLRNVSLTLYNAEGEVQDSVLTDSSGFYYFSAVPPGRYLLIIDEKSAMQGKFIRPEPEQIEIGYDGTVIYGNDIYVETGSGDIPSAFLPDLDDYKARHPHIDFSHETYDTVLNLGEFNSRLLMSVVWYKIRSRYYAILVGGDLFVPPTESFADAKTGKTYTSCWFKGGFDRGFL